MYGDQPFHRLELENDSIFDDNVEPVSAIQAHLLVGDRERHLTLEADLGVLQLVTQAFFIGGFQQARAKLAMNFDCKADDPLRQRVRKIKPQLSEGQLVRVIGASNQAEAEMKRIGFWTEDPPDLIGQADRGELRSFLDAPTFELWLQCVFLPGARRAVHDDALRAQSQVGLMALRQYDYHSYNPDAQELLRLLNEFDRVVEARRST